MAVQRTKQESITLYDPETGLKTIAVAQAGERHWARAKDATKLFAAIETKIIEQAKYVVWRDSVVTPSREMGISGPGRGKKGKQKNRVSVLKPGLPETDPGKLVVHRWRKKFCVKAINSDDDKLSKAIAAANRKVLTIIDAAKITVALDDARVRCVRICEQQNLSTIRGTEGTGEFERYTPSEYIEAARMVLGEFDVDPATSEQAQKVVKAKSYFTEKTNGLDREWHGRVWMNPPYHRELAPKFINKLVEEFNAGRTKESIVLTNNSTDTEWFNTAFKVCSGICFSKGRIKFYVPKGEDVLPTQGQAFFYFGPNVERFEDVFCTIGICVRPSRQFQGVDDARGEQPKSVVGLGIQD